MKRIVFLLVLAGCSLFATRALAEEADSTGLPGDHFDLQGAMELFKNAKNLQEFEKALNTEANAVNNLDLNGDNKIDYITVKDKVEGNSHAIILQVPVNKTETQDVAVIVIEKTGEKTAQLQIIGDEELYGEEKVMEPYAEQTEKTNGPSEFSTALSPAVVFVNVWSWPCVTYIYYPSYIVYVSPWYWDYYPYWWDPWAPYPWYVYHPRVVRYHYMYYHSAPSCYLNHAHGVYRQHRTTSATVRTRYARAHQDYREAQTAKPKTGRANQPIARPIDNNATPGRDKTPQPSKPVTREQPTERPVAQPAERPVAKPEARPVPAQRTPGATERKPATPPAQRPATRPDAERKTPARATPAPAQRQINRQPSAPRSAPRPAPSRGGSRPTRGGR